MCAFIACVWLTGLCVYVCLCTRHAWGCPWRMYGCACLCDVRGQRMGVRVHVCLDHMGRCAITYGLSPTF